MSEEMRALLGAECKIQRLMVREAHTVPPVGGSQANPKRGLFRFQYQGAGIFYPIAVYAYSISNVDGQASGPSPRGFDMDVRRENGDLVLDYTAIRVGGQFNNYYDNFDYDMGLTGNETYLMNYKCYAGATSITIYAVFIGQEYLF